MIVDSSVLVCLLLNEPECARFKAVMERADEKLISAGTWVELGAVVARRQLATREELKRVVRLQQIRVAMVTVEQGEIAHEAYWRFGIGSGHHARLNFGDCFSYALAKATGEPLLFKGDDFNHTDLLLAPESAYPR